MSAPQYESYRDSGVEWLGEIPSHWAIAPVKRAIGFTTGWTPPTGRDEFYDGDQPWANISDLNGRYLEDTAKKITQAAVAEAKGRTSPAGSLLFSFKLSIGQVAFAQKDMFTNEAIATFLPSVEVDLQFAYYAFPLFVVANAAENIYGAKLLNQELIRNAVLALPPPVEQAAIAAFLDRETSKIDALVETQTLLIELLKEKRQAVISQAVTKGLDPAAPMKDSGVEWLGQVPAHWQVVAIRMLFTLGRGRVLSHQDIAENAGPYPVYSSQTEKDGEMGCISTFDFEGDYLTWTTDGANAGTVFRRSGRFNCTNVCGTLKPKADLNLDFFQAALAEATGFYVRHDINPKLMNNVMGGIRIPLPPRDEQSAIAAHMREQTKGFALLAGEAEAAVTLLQERRAALISAAVTGKIDVRGLVSKQAEAA